MADQLNRPLLANGQALAQDEQKRRGPGDKFHPQDFDAARKTLGPMISGVRKAADALPDGLRGERIVVEATLLPNYLAATYEPKHLRSSVDLVVIGTKAARGTLRTRKRVTKNQPTKALLLAATPRSLQRLDEVVNGLAPATDSLIDDIVKLQSISLPGSERVKIDGALDSPDADPDEELVWEVVLHPAIGGDGALSDRAHDLVLQRWRALVQRLHGDVHERFIREVAGLTFMPVRLRRSALQQAATFNPIRVIRPMPRMRRLPTSSLRRVDAAPAPTPPDGLPEADHRIAVFDGGVDMTHMLLAPYVTEVDVTDAPRDSDCVDHGTMVTSAALFGHVQLGKQLAPPPAHVDHFRMLPEPAHLEEGDEPYWFADEMYRHLRTGRWRLASLSYGPNKPVDDDAEPDYFTTLMDRLVYEQGVTIAVAVGNDGQPTPSPLGLDRVMAPADAVNVLGVGACTESGLTPPQRADYSSIGPGRAGLRVQPLGVSFGGTPEEAFVGAAPGGGYQMGCGTSYATPYAARGLATLLGPLQGPHFNVNTSRAFAAHFATPPVNPDLVAVGYGRYADDYRSLLECPGDEVTVLVEDVLERGHTKAYPFPVPAAGLQGKIHLRWTVSYASDIDERDATEYTLAGLDVDWRPNSAKLRLEPPKGTRGKGVDVDIRNSADAKLVQERVKAGWRLSTNAKTRSGAAIRSEQTLRDEGKWETVVRFEDSVLTSTLHDPQVWLTYYERAEGQLVERSESTDLDFAMLLTVRAPKVRDLYDRVRTTAQFKVLTPLTATVPAHVETRV